MEFLLALFLLFEGDGPTEAWIVEQKAQIMKAGGHPDLARVMHHAFNTRRITADESALAADWGRVTGDGAALDPYELADRLLRLALALELDIRPADSEQGPVLLSVAGGSGWIVGYGDRGSWVERTKGAPLPAALDTGAWASVLLARQAMKEHAVGRPALLESLDVSATTPLLARALVMKKGPSLAITDLLDICKRFPALADLRAEGLRRCLATGDLVQASAFWMEGSGPQKADLWVQGALLERRLGNTEASLRLLRVALRQDPCHAEALALLRGPG